MAAPVEIVRVRLDIEATGESRRDAERPATLTIENNGAEPLRVSRVTHLHREQTYGDLCGELRLLIQDEYFFNNPDLIAARKNEIIKLINEAIVAAPGPGMISNIFRVWRVFLSPLLAAAAFRRWQDRFNANQLVIEDYQDAQLAWELVADLPVPEPEAGTRNRELIELKLRQLKELDNERLSAASGQNDWILDPHSSHSEALTLSCAKSMLSVRRYPVVIEVTATSLDGGRPTTKRASASIEVPPRDLPLAVLAMIAAPAGLFARIAVQNPHASASKLISLTSLPQILIATVLGFVLSITFERLRWGSAAKLSLSWRTAILLGFGAGLGTENLLKAFQAFFGVS
jgi:hypothetical protein